MNTQELQMILEALRQITGDAAGAAQWWIVAHYGAQYFSTLMVFAGVAAVAGSLAWTVVKVSSIGIKEAEAKAAGQQWAQFGMKVARALGGEGSEYSYTRDEMRITAALMQAVQREAEKGEK